MLVASYIQLGIKHASLLSILSSQSYWAAYLVMPPHVQTPRTRPRDICRSIYRHNSTDIGIQTVKPDLSLIKQIK